MDETPGVHEMPPGTPRTLEGHVRGGIAPSWQCHPVRSLFTLLRTVADAVLYQGLAKGGAIHAYEPRARCPRCRGALGAIGSGLRCPYCNHDTGRKLWAA